MFSGTSCFDQKKALFFFVLILSHLLFSVSKIHAEVVRFAPVVLAHNPCEGDYQRMYSILTCVDLDADDDIDIFVSNQYRGAPVYWLENIGDMQFSEHIIFDSIGVYNAIPVDFDHDGLMDIVGVTGDSNTVLLYRNLGNWAMEVRTLDSLLVFPNNCYAADFNNDQRMDILVTSNYDSCYWFELHDEEIQRHLLSRETGSWYLSCIRDYNNDGYLDLLYSTSLIRLSVCINDQDNTFTDREVNYTVHHAYDVIRCISDENESQILCMKYFNQRYNLCLLEYENNAYDLETIDEYQDYGNIYACDFDEDGDDDMLVWGETDSDSGFFYYECSPGFMFRRSFIDMEGYAGPTCYKPKTIIDMDGDGDQDLVYIEQGGAYDIVMLELVEVDHTVSPPELVSPADRIVLQQAPYTFVWRTSPDIDPGDSITYRLEIGRTRSFEDSLYFDAGQDTTVTVDIDIEQRLLYWRVWAFDGSEDVDIIEPELCRSFRLPMPALELYEPPDDTFIAGSDANDITFTWERIIEQEHEDFMHYRIDIVIHYPEEDDIIESFNTNRPTLPRYSIRALMPETGWNEEVEVEWWAYAIFNTDTASCEESYSFTLTPWVGVEDSERNAVPELFRIAAAAPNPFNNQTRVSIGVPATGSVTVELFDILGRHVRTLCTNTSFTTGWHTLTINADNMANGVYFLSARYQGEAPQIQKLLLLK